MTKKSETSETAAVQPSRPHVRVKALASFSIQTGTIAKGSEANLTADEADFHKDKVRVLYPLS